MSATGVQRLQLDVETSPIAAVRQAVDRLAHDAGLTDEARFDLQVAVSEAVANAVRHGSSGAAHVDVVLGLRDGTPVLLAPAREVAVSDLRAVYA